MIYEFTLSHPVLGTLTISEPGGWLTTKIRLERHNDFKSIIEYFGGGQDDDNAGDFTFYGDNGVINGGIDFIREAIRSYGADTDVNVTIRLSFDGYTFNDVFVGQLALWAAKFIPDNKVQIPIIRNNFWTKFINRLSTPVDLQGESSLDSEDVNNFDSVTLNLTPQILRTKYLNEQDEGEISELPGVGYYQITPDGIVLDEIEDTYNLPFALNPDIPVWWLEAYYAGEYTFNIRIEVSQLVNVLGNEVLTEFVSGGINSPNTFVFVKNGDTPIDFTRVDNAGTYNGTNIYSCWDTPPGGGVIALGSTVFTYSTVLQLNKGDVIRIYLNRTSGSDNVKAFLWGKQGVPCLDSSFQAKDAQSGLPPGMELVPTYFDVVAQTVFPETDASSFLIHDAGGQICDRIISQNDSFYSEYLGSDLTLYRQYEQNGCGWEFIIAKGLQLRQYSLIEKPFFLSFIQWWNGINPILNLGLGYESVNGDEVIRVERVEYFYDRSQVSINISNIREISYTYDESVTLKTVKNGYKQWQSENISGIDDSQTKHTRASRLQKAGREMIDESDFIGASLAIETTRRMTRQKSADYKFDDNTFIVSINPVEVSPMNYEPKLDENFSSITNLLNSYTRYNSLITPARNFFRRLSLYSIGVQDYISSFFKFTGGEGNYDMTSDYDTSDGCDQVMSPVSEKMDIPVSSEALHRNELFEMVVPMEWEDYLTIRDNRNYPIGVSQTDSGHVKMFIKDLTFEPFKSRATINAWTTEPFEIKVIQTEILGRVCDAVTDECEEALLTEDSFELITEDGDCLVLE